MNKGFVAAIAAFCCAAVFAGGLKVERRRPLTANVGVVSVGLDTYWKQCPGLYDDMVKKEDAFVRMLNVAAARSASAPYHAADGRAV
ncbi:MAG: hypothetical protein IJG13_21265, partial [Kiritimatiellae bacterium]|nr:hypothetical protein [Kiritimatiellia bacterium]